MNKKHLFLYIFLNIITLGLINIYWRKKHRQAKIKKELSVSEKIAFDLDELITNLGGKENIANVDATQKILKIDFLNRELINVDQIKKIDGINGISFSSKTISLVVGNSAKYIVTLLK